MRSGPNQKRDAFKRFQRLTRTNLCKLAVDSMVRRTAVTGYRDTSEGSGTVYAPYPWPSADSDKSQVTHFTWHWLTVNEPGEAR